MFHRLVSRIFNSYLRETTKIKTTKLSTHDFDCDRD